jgi:hypothetical protein
MEEPREVTTSINERFFTIDLPIEDEHLIASVLLGLGQYVKRGFPIKVKQSYIADWGKETKGLISALLKR